MEKEKKRVNWSELETHFMLIIMRDKNILDMLGGKRYRNADIFKIVEEELKKRGFLKSIIQIRTKWKALKLQYYKAKRDNSISGNDRVFWNELEELLGHRPACNVEGVDTSCVLSSGVDETENSEGDGDTPEVVEVVLETKPSAGSSKEPDSEQLGEQGPVRKKRKAEGDGHTTEVVEVVLESEPSAGSSKEPDSDQLSEQGPVIKKRKVEKKGYSEALKSFSKDIKESQKEIANMFLERQAEIIARELEGQRQWEQKLLEEDRIATERMMTNLMSSFFHNLRQTYPQPHQFSFFNPSQAFAPNSTPIPFPSPVSPTFTFPPSQVHSNPNCVPLLSPSSVSPTINSPPPEAPSNPSHVPLPDPSPVIASETQSSTQADGKEK